MARLTRLSKIRLSKIGSVRFTSAGSWPDPATAGAEPKEALAQSSGGRGVLRNGVFEGGGAFCRAAGVSRLGSRTDSPSRRLGRPSPPQPPIAAIATPQKFPPLQNFGENFGADFS